MAERGRAASETLSFTYWKQSWHGAESTLVAGEGLIVPHSPDSAQPGSQSHSGQLHWSHSSPHCVWLMAAAQARTAILLWGEGSLGGGRGCSRD